MVPMCTIGMDGPHVYNRDGWSPCAQVDDGLFEPLCAKKNIWK